MEPIFSFITGELYVILNQKILKHKMMKKNSLYYILVILLVMASQILAAQNNLIGKVTDTSNKPLVYANVYLPEQNKGAQTDEKGNYVLTNVPQGNIKIQFSYVGYKTVIKTIHTDGSKQTVNVALKPSPMQTGEVVVSGGTYSTQHENAIKIDLVNSQTLVSAGTPSMIQALTQIPGVDMISKGDGVAKPVIRGLSMTNILMLNNGVKLENFQFSENHPFIIDEFGVDRIEVIKGPASLLYGSDAVGGVINVIKEKPAPAGKIIGDYNMQYHSNTQGIVTNLGIKGSTNSFFWGLRAGMKSNKDYADGNGFRVPNTRFNENSLKAFAGFNKSFGVFRVYYDYNRPKLGMCVGDAVPLVIENGRGNKYWHQDLTNQIISTKNTLFLGNYKVDVNAAYQMNNRKLQTDSTKPSFDMVDMQMNTLSYEVKTYLPSNVGSEYIVGIQGANKTNRNQGAPNHVIPDADVNDFSVFGLAQKTFFEKLKTQAGARYDYRHITTVEETGKPAVDVNYGNVSGSVGATYDITDQFLLRANLASAYRTPNIAELTENGLHGTRYEEGSSDLKSQRNYEADLSAHFHSDNLMVDISGFYNWIKNYIYITPTADSIGGYRVYRYSQTDSKIYGGELSLEYLPLDWLDLKASYSYLIGKEISGEYLPFIPQNKWHWEVNFKKDKLSFLQHPYVRMGGLYAAAQNHPAMFETASDSYFLLNAGIGADLKVKNQTFNFSIVGNNLLDEVYIDHLSTLKDMGYNNMGRNISFNIKIPFGLK